VDSLSNHGQFVAILATLLVGPLVVLESPFDNDLLPQYPAGYDLPNIISVAATDQSDTLADFSNYGKT